MTWFVQFYSKVKGIHFRGSRTHLDKNKLVQNWPFRLIRIAQDVCACVFYSLQVFSSFQFANFEYIATTATVIFCLNSILLKNALTLKSGTGEED